MDSLHPNPEIKISSLSNYRPLLHVIGYANHHENDALSVIQNAVRGGVISVIRQEDPSQAPATGLNERSSSEINNTSTDSLIEKVGRGGSSVDLGTYALLPSSASISVLSLMVVQGYFCPSLPFMVESGRQAYNYRSEVFPRDSFTVVILLFPDCFVEPKEFVDSDFWEDIASGTVEPSLRRGSTSPSADQGTPSRSVGAGISTSPSNLFSSTSIAINKVTSSVSDLKSVLRAREEIAVNYLASINHALYQIKMYETERLSAQTSQRQTDSKTKDSTTNTAPQNTAESYTLRTLSNELERTKVALLMCLCAASIKVDTHGTSAASLFLKLSKGVFHESFESQQRPQDVSKHDAWYDECQRDITETYKQFHYDDNAPSTLDGFLEQIRTRSKRSAREVMAAGTVMLHRPHDGHFGVFLTPTGLFNRSPPVLPHLPIQQGEVQFIISPQPISFDSSANPLSGLLHKCTTRRLGPSETQSDPLLQKNGLKSLSSQEKMVLSAFALNTDNVLKFMEKNPEILSQMILNFAETYESSVGNKNCSTVSSELKFAASVVHLALYSTTFTVSVGKFLRELVRQGYFQRETIIKWVEHCCSTYEASPDQFSRSFFALVDFMIARLECELAPETLQCLSKMRLANR